MNTRFNEQFSKESTRRTWPVVRKLIQYVFFSILLVVSCYTGYSQAQVYVNVRPVYAAPRARPLPPGRAYIWIGEDWVWRGGRYVPVGGRWVMPPHPGYIWFPGRWISYHRGWQWVPGRWRRHY